MTTIGYGALALALVISTYNAAAFILGARRGSPRLAGSAHKGVMATAVLVTLASAILIYLLLTRDFQVRYVYQHVSTYLPTIYALSAFWAGQEGSLLLWLWFLTLISWIVARGGEGWSQELKPYALAVLALCQAFFALLLVLASNPFATYPARPPEGLGLNPLLENFWMIIHPPVVFMGYAAYTVPFAFAIAALITGRLGDEWIRGIRRWNLFAWLFLGLGILLGGWWAYLELGWGGYWGWDPVENASLIPWLAGTALLHSAMTQGRRGIFRVWNMALISLTFVLCIFATFVTRSGILQSVHAFGQSAIGSCFLAFLAAILALSFGLTLHRRRELASQGELKSLLSREAGLLLNNLLFGGLALAVLIGTVFPAVSEIVMGRQMALGPSFFERVSAPLALAIVLLIGICPLLGWRRTSSGRLVRNLLYPGITALAVAGVIFLLGIKEPFALLSFPVCAFVASSILREFLRGTRARHRSTGEHHLLALGRLIARNRSRYGGYLVHLSMVMITMGVVGSSLYQSEYQVALARGERVAVQDYALEYERFVGEATPAKHRFAILLGVYRDGRRIATLVPEKNFHWNVEQWVTEVAIRTSLKEDLYVILAGLSEDGSATFQILINPLVVWLWIGGGLLLVGTMVAIWPSEAQSSNFQLPTSNFQRERVGNDRGAWPSQVLRQQGGPGWR
ncbi:MAG TPA: heme lyase CcmF/NrfE family subunit [Anaerolineae bacterium]|nr:heme lyase CcmF/NrfE family subunit [Anaerolineae bacterium]